MVTEGGEEGDVHDRGSWVEGGGRRVSEGVEEGGRWLSQRAHGGDYSEGGEGGVRVITE